MGNGAQGRDTVRSKRLWLERSVDEMTDQIGLSPNLSTDLVQFKTSSVIRDESRVQELGVLTDRANGCPDLPQCDLAESVRVVLVPGRCWVSDSRGQVSE